MISIPDGAIFTITDYGVNVFYQPNPGKLLSWWCDTFSKEDRLTDSSDQGCSPGFDELKELPESRTRPPIVLSNTWKTERWTCEYVTIDNMAGVYIKGLFLNNSQPYYIKVAEQVPCPHRISEPVLTTRRKLIRS